MKTYKPSNRIFLKWLKTECAKIRALDTIPSALHLLDKLPRFQNDFKADLGYDYQVLKAQCSIERKNWIVGDYYLNQDGWRKLPTI